MAESPTPSLYGKPLSKKKIRTGHETAQTDGQTNGRTDKVIPIYPPPLSFFHGGIKNIAAFSKSFKHALNQSCVP